MSEALRKRFGEVVEELRNAKNSVDMLTEQLEKQKIHFHVVTGHHNELHYQLMEAQKLLDQPASTEAVEPVPTPEQENGQANEQAEEQAA